MILPKEFNSDEEDSMDWTLGSLTAERGLTKGRLDISDVSLVGLTGESDALEGEGNGDDGDGGGILTGTGIKSPSRSLLPTDFTCCLVILILSVSGISSCNCLLCFLRRRVCCQCPLIELIRKILERLDTRQECLEMAVLTG